VTITVTDTIEHKTVVLGPISVTYGVDPKMGPCPICRRPVRTKSPPSSWWPRPAVCHPDGRGAAGGPALATGV